MWGKNTVDHFASFQSSKYTYTLSLLLSPSSSNVDQWKCAVIARRDLCLETKPVIKDIGKRYVNLEFGNALDFSVGIIYYSEIVLLLLAEAVLFQCHSQSQLLRKPGWLSDR